MTCTGLRVTPGQAAYEDMRGAARTRYPTRLPWQEWERLREDERNEWEAAAQAAITAWQAGNAAAVLAEPDALHIYRYACCAHCLHDYQDDEYINGHVARCPEGCNDGEGAA